MSDLISSVDALFSYYGATLFVLGLLCCLMKRTFKFGVLTMLLADIPLALAIAFPRKVIEQLNSWGFQAQDLPDPQTGHTYGIIAGVVTFIVLLALRYLLNSALNKRKVVPQNAEPGDDAPIDISEDDPSINQVNDNKNEGGLFKGLAIKGKKSHQSASALHLSSNDNPLNLADTQAEFSALKKNDEHVELGKNLGSEPSFTQDPHEDFALGSIEHVQDNHNDDLREPTLSTDVFKNHMSHNEPNFSNSFIENASSGSLKHDYGSEQKPLENNQSSVGIQSLGVQNPLTGQTDKTKSSWSSLLSKINQVSKDDQNKESSENSLQERFASLGGDDNFSGYGPKSRSIAQKAANSSNVPYIGSESQESESMDLNSLSFAGNKVGDLLDVIDDPNNDDKLKERLGIKESKQSDSNSNLNFADLLDSASKDQNLDSYDQLSVQPQNSDRFGNDNLSQAQLNEELLAYGTLEKNHKTVAEALADLELQEQEQQREQVDIKDHQHLNSELLNPSNLDDSQEPKVDIGTPDPSLQIMEPTKISYLYSDPVHEDNSKEEEDAEEDKGNVLEQYQGDATNYSFSIKGVFKEKPKLSVSGFVDRTSYLGQSQYEADFHEKELEQMVNSHEQQDGKTVPTKLNDKQDHKIKEELESSSNHSPSDELKNKRDQVLEVARQVSAQISAELEAKKGSSVSNKDLVGKASKQDFSIGNLHSDDNQDEAHALASVFAKNKSISSSESVLKEEQQPYDKDSSESKAAFNHKPELKVESLASNETSKLSDDSTKVEAKREPTLESQPNKKLESAKGKAIEMNNVSYSLTLEHKAKPHTEQQPEPKLDLSAKKEPANKQEQTSVKKEKRPIVKGASLDMLKAKAKELSQAKIKEQKLNETKKQAVHEPNISNVNNAKVLSSSNASVKTEPVAIQQVAIPLESKSTLNNVSNKAKNINMAELSRQRGLSFIEKLKAKNVKPHEDNKIINTSNKEVVKNNILNTQSIVNKGEAKPNNQIAAKNTVKSQVTDLSKITKADLNNIKPNNIKANTQSSNNTKVTKAPTSAMSKVNKVLAPSGKVPTASAIDNKAQSKVQAKVQLEPKNNASISIKANNIDKAQPSVPTTLSKNNIDNKKLVPENTVSTVGNSKAHEALSSLPKKQEIAKPNIVKATLKNKRRTHKKDDESAVELSKEALIKDAALASMSKLDDLEEGALKKAPNNAESSAAPHINESQKKESPVRKIASLKRSVGLKRN